MPSQASFTRLSSDEISVDLNAAQSILWHAYQQPGICVSVLAPVLQLYSTTALRSDAAEYAGGTAEKQGQGYAPTTELMPSSDCHETHRSLLQSLCSAAAGSWQARLCDSACVCVASAGVV